MNSDGGRGSVAIVIDIDSELERLIQRAAARRQLSMGEYVVEVLRHALEEPGRMQPPGDDPAWTQLSSPSFARDWDSREDAVYDELPAR